MRRAWMGIPLALSVLVTGQTVPNLPAGKISHLRNSPHDFSATSNADKKAASANQLCFFCHTPHRAEGKTPLWNRPLKPDTTPRPYSSPTLSRPAGVPQTTDSSKLCLSCHDGTVALGDT